MGYLWCQANKTFFFFPFSLSLQWKVEHALALHCALGVSAISEFSEFENKCA